MEPIIDSGFQEIREGADFGITAVRLMQFLE